MSNIIEFTQNKKDREPISYEGLPVISSQTLKSIDRKIPQEDLIMSEDSRKDDDYTNEVEIYDDIIKLKHNFLKLVGVPEEQWINPRRGNYTANSCYIVGRSKIDHTDVLIACMITEWTFSWHVIEQDLFEQVLTESSEETLGYELNYLFYDGGHEEAVFEAEERLVDKKAAKVGQRIFKKVSPVRYANLLNAAKNSPLDRLSLNISNFPEPYRSDADFWKFIFEERIGVKREKWYQLGKRKYAYIVGKTKEAGIDLYVLVLTTRKSFSWHVIDCSTIHRMLADGLDFLEDNLNEFFYEEGYEQECEDTIARYRFDMMARQ